MAKESDSKLFAFIGVFLTWVGFIIVLLAKKHDKYAMHYAKQGLILGIAWIIAWFIMMIPILGWIVGGIAMVVLFIFWIMGIIYAFSDEEKDIPVIGNIAKSIKL